MTPRFRRRHAEDMTHKPTLAEVIAERDAWREAAKLYQKLAADGVLRIKQGYSYAQAQELYDKALATEPRPEGDTSE